MKKGILEILLFILVACAFLWTGMELKDREWKAKVFVRANPADTTRTIETMPMPEQKKTIQNPVKVTPQHKINADSIFNAGIAKGVDSARAIFVNATAPEETTIVFDSVGTLYHSFDPLTRLSIFGMQPFPRQREIFRITDSVFVPMPSGQSWYDHWYIGALGTIGMFTAIVTASK